MVAGVICYFIGRWRYGYVIGCVMVSLCAWAYINLGMISYRGLEWQFEKQENMKTLYTSEGESVEWLNYMVEKIWRSIDPEFFADIEDLLEDTIQSVSPSFIKAVKVSDFDIGVQAPRIQMIRIFPPLPGQPEESIFGELAFSFHAHPVASLVTKRSTKSTPPGLTIRFLTALKAPLDIKAELTALSGKVRFKLLTSPEVPFVSKATISFTSVPQIETGVMPLTKHLNIMNLPTIKTLVNEGIKLGFADFVDPKSMTVDLKALLGAMAQDVEAIGLVKVEVREANRTSSKKLTDMEDSYATLSLSSAPKKTLSSTRVLTNDKNPRWNENLYVLIGKDDIVSETTVDVKVWDADKVKFDDMWGSISMSVKDIVQGKVDKLGNVSSWCQEERVIFDGWTPIDGKSEDKSKIKLNMKLSFHPKYPTPNMDVFSGDALTKHNDNEQSKQEKQVLLDTEVLPSHNNGILSVTIHQAMDLEVGDPGVLPSDEKFKHPYDPSQTVSPYAVLYVNDNKVYQSRTKLRNPSPHWNAMSEHFIKDVETTSIRVVVKTAVDLERDPVLGTKLLHLSDLFHDQQGKFKEIQQWLPLSNGIGFGKILLTVKYKPVKITLPRELQGADVGTLIIDNFTLTDLKTPFDSHNINDVKATIALNLDPVIIKRLKSKDIRRPSQDSLATRSGWYDQTMYFPLMMRYRTAVYVHITQGSISTVKATGRFWLKEIPDNEWHDVVLGLRPYLSEKDKAANKNEDSWPELGELGQISMRMKIVPGFSPVHTHLNSYNKDMVGADPFYEDTIKYKARQWIKNQSEETDEMPSDIQAAVQMERSKEDVGLRRTSSLSSEYGQESDSDTEMHDDMLEQRKTNKINKHRVMRKLTWSMDKMKHKVNTLRDGFNSETRASRNVAKEA
ncbi:hypothetical protein BDB01DRAFT_359888 [Pilobolus umbonatus]|nr:hypothetical protein BDB01DRAFT_359888 [Pilobolus umbonatus]